MNLNQELCKTRTRALFEGIDIGKRKALDELKKLVNERLRVVATLLAEYEDSDRKSDLKTVIETGRVRIEELEKILEKINSMREKK